MINLAELPQEIRDRIELRESSDQTFYRFVDVDYTELFWNMLTERADTDKENSVICSVIGQQGAGKCYYEETKVTTSKGVKSGKDVVKGDYVVDEKGNFIKVNDVWKTKKKCVKLSFDFAKDVMVSKEHKFMTKRGLLSVDKIVEGDRIPLSIRNCKDEGSEKEYERGVVFGAYIGDGTGVSRKKFVKAKRKKGLRGSGCVFEILISNNDYDFLKNISVYMEKRFNFTSVSIRKASGRGKWVLTGYGKESVEEFIELCGKNSNSKKVPLEVFETKEGVRGFLDGYCGADMTCNVSKSVKGTYRCEVGWTVKSMSLGLSILELLHIEDVWPRVAMRVLKSGKYKGNEYLRLSLPAKKIEDFFERRTWLNSSKEERVKYLLKKRKERETGSAYNTINGNRVVTNDKFIHEEEGVKYATVKKINDVGVLDCVDMEVDSSTHLFSFAGGLVTHNSWSAIAMCHFMDPNFSHDKIFFSYSDLVHHRAKLKPHSAVLLDEQTQSYGLDSNRVMIILQSIKEQLRKKSIHLFFCSPVLHPESHTSMYIIEVMFIDKETEEAYAVLKTREGQTLGHIRIPSPLKVLEDGTSLATGDFMQRYEAIKDDHLEKLLGQKHMDVFEDRAIAVMESKLFKKAEGVYRKQLGYIPRDRVVQIINKLFPEYNAGVVPQEIAERIRMTRELEGKWKIPGAKKKSKK